MLEKTAKVLGFKYLSRVSKLGIRIGRILTESPSQTPPHARCVCLQKACHHHHSILSTSNLNLRNPSSPQCPGPIPSAEVKSPQTFHFDPVSRPAISHNSVKLSTLCRHMIFGSLPTGDGFLTSCPLTFPVCLPNTILPFVGLNVLMMRLQTLNWSSQPKRCKKLAA